MRSIWITTGLVIVVLALAAGMNRGQRGGAETGTASDAPLIEPSDVTAPHSLSAEDLNRIIELRAEIGGAANRIGGESIAPAAFERELRQLAGLRESVGDQSQNTAATGDRAADMDVILVFRESAAALDDAANSAERTGDYGRADHLRGLAGKLRRLARLQDSQGSETFSRAEDVADGLIDKSQPRQAQ